MGRARRRAHDGGAWRQPLHAAGLRRLELYVDWRIEPGGDSGIYLRGLPQVQIWDDPAVGSGGLYNNVAHRSTPLVVADHAPGEWNRFHILMRGDRVTVYLNGRRVVDDTPLEDHARPGQSIPARGPIELQTHGSPLQFRNLFIRDLDEADDVAEPDDRLAWWREARFGMFIHWGLYAIPAGVWNGQEVPGVGEWILHHGRIPPAEYETLAARFDPVDFDARAWARFAADAGMRYVVITTKHHDGFCLFDSAQTTFDVMEATPFRRDAMREIADACREAGLRVGWYHSILDWHHPDARGEAFPSYAAVMRRQVAELLTRYGPIDVMWFDGEWIDEWTHEEGVELYQLCRALRPGIIVNNRVGKGRQGMAGLTAGDRDDHPGDFGTPEQEVPTTGLPGVDWESCMTMNDTWGYKASDENWKSTETLIRTLVDVVSKGGNFLLNVGPDARGRIPQPSVERLMAMGAWLKVNGASIHGCGAGPFRKPLSWGRCTANLSSPGTLYLHVFDWPEDGTLEVPGVLNEVVACGPLADAIAAWTCESGDRGLVVHLPAEPLDPIDTVVRLEVFGAPAVVELPAMPDADGSLHLHAIDAEVRGHSARYQSRGGKDNIGFWTDPDDLVAWRVSGLSLGKYCVEIEYACIPQCAGSTYAVEVHPVDANAVAVAASQAQHRTGVEGCVASTGSWMAFHTAELGALTIEEEQANAREWEIIVRPLAMPGGAVMNLRRVSLIPAR